MPNIIAYVQQVHSGGSLSTKLLFLVLLVVFLLVPTPPASKVICFKGQGKGYSLEIDGALVMQIKAPLALKLIEDLLIFNCF